MTREEAIAIFRGFKLLPREMEAVNMAIKALKKEPCEDWHDVPSDEMTLEQAREFLQDRIRFIDGNYPEAIGYKQALKTAVRELGKQQCEDCISRQEAVEKINALCNDDVNNPYRDNPHIDAIVDQLMDLPSVKPQPKIGRWIEGKYRDDDIRYNDSSYKCNKCGRIVDFKENYCPDCGALMKGELE